MERMSFDRMAGVLVAAASGDALGAGYEFGPPVPSAHPVAMRGSGVFEPGEWTDDTAQLLAIALAAGDGHDLCSVEGEDAVAARFQDWYLSPARLKDIGVHSSQVFAAVETLPVPGLAQRFRDTAEAKEARQPGSSGGNGALMRTAGVAVAMHDRTDRELMDAAMRIGSMTHADQRSTEACAIWSMAIRLAALHQGPWTDEAIDELGDHLLKLVRGFLPESAAFWTDAIRAAHRAQPVDFYGARPTNGYSVTALQAAWAAVSGTPVPVDRPARHLRLATEAAVRGGGDTDTVACIAGALLGAMWGYSAVPLQWRRRIFGWPGMRDGDLLRLAHAIQHGGFPQVRQDVWPHSAQGLYVSWAGTGAVGVHPHDAGVVLAGVDAARGKAALPEGTVDAVVSLCRIGRHDLDWLGLPAYDHVEVRLVDQDGDEANPHLALVMEDAADAVAQFRAEGKRVLLHCVQAQSRTPSVAALYSVRHLGVEPARALREVCAALPDAHPNRDLAEVVLGADRMSDRCETTGVPQ